ncbi:MAG: phenylalanine--tRNA ligase subunit alpha [Candidatus Woesearchaeota archaeon]
MKKDVLKYLTDDELLTLKIIKKNNITSTTLKELSEKVDLPKIKLMRALEWLNNKNVIDLEYEEYELIILEKNGKKYSDENLPEYSILEKLKKNEKLSRNELLNFFSNNEISFSIGFLKKNDCIDLEKDNGLYLVYKKDLPHSFQNDFLKGKSFPLKLSELDEKEKYSVESLLKRKDIIDKKKKTEKKISLTKEGKKLIKEDIESLNLIDSVDKKIISEFRDNSKDFEFRKYDVESSVPKKSFPKKHVIDQVLGDFREIWISMGFEEMKGNILDSSFNILDTLFVPQDHPARSLQDTFYAGNKKDSIYQKEIKNQNYKQKIKSIHTNGTIGGEKISRGWNYDWSEEEGKNVMLRSHTTVLSVLKLLSEKKKYGKFFSLGKNFRNETLDWKHSFQFHQIEGIVVHPDANLKNHFWFIKQFFERLGFDDVRLRPAYFPYTEPSMEVDVYVEERDEWLELGGSGIFRPEVVEPIFGEFVPVLAWGMGFDRFAMKLFNVKDIRELYSKDISKLKNFPLLK